MEGARVRAFRVLCDDTIPCKPDLKGPVIEGTVNEVDAEHGTMSVCVGMEDGSPMFELCAIEGAEEILIS